MVFLIKKLYVKFVIIVKYFKKRYENQRIEIKYLYNFEEDLDIKYLQILFFVYYILQCDFN